MAAQSKGARRCLGSSGAARARSRAGGGRPAARRGRRAPAAASSYLLHPHQAPERRRLLLPATERRRRLRAALRPRRPGRTSSSDFSQSSSGPLATRTMEKSRVLVVGGTGYIGRRLVRASLAQGHPTLVLLRPEIGLDMDKLQTLLSFKAQGARLVEASLEDHAALVVAVAQGDVVISAMSGVHFRSHNLSLQHKLVDAIKDIIC